MPNHQALQLCPTLIILPIRMQDYRDVSKKVFSILHRYTPLVEVVSIDEAYLDVTNCPLNGGSATYIANAIRHDIYQETQLTASAGVAPNKFLAKIASDENKPNGQFVITPETLHEFVRTLPLEKIPGVGKATIEKLHQLGLYTGQDAIDYGETALTARFGKFGQLIFERAQGIDNREIVLYRERKSIGVEKTLIENIIGFPDCWQTLKSLTPELQRRIAQKKAFNRIKKLGVKIKFADFTQTTVEQQAVGLDMGVFQALLEKGLARDRTQAVRLIGIHVGLETINQEQQLRLPLEQTTSE